MPWYFLAAKTTFTTGLERGAGCGANGQAVRAGDRRRGHVHRHRRLRRGNRPPGEPQGADHARRPLARRHGGDRPAAARERDCTARHRPTGARHDALQQRADRAQGRADRAHHDQGLPRHARDRARAQVRALRHPHRQAGAAGAAPPAPGGAGADGRRRQRAHSARRGGRARRRGTADGRGRHLAGHRLPAFLRQPGARAAGRGAAGQAPPRPHAVGLHRGGARDPRVRARLHHGHQRLHQAAGRALHLRAQRAGSRRAASPRRCC